MPDQELLNAIQEGFVNPLKARLQKTEKMLRWVLLLLAINSLVTGILLALVMTRS